MSDEAQIVELLKARAIPPDAPYRPEVYLSNGARGSQAIANWTGEIAMPQAFRGREASVWVAFIDLMPEANFEHPVRYAFVIPGLREVEVVDAMSPPADLATNFHKLDLNQ